VVRGGEPITDFHRPIVLRLLQYLALHRGQAIPRERLLADLWPDSDLDKAARSFRTVYSRLRNALEPMMRRNGPNRYVDLDGERITFDPHGCVTTDVERFEAALAAALATDAPVANETVGLLAAYAPLLAEMPYADWLLERRERVHELYVNGCLRVGEELLAREKVAEAQQWARRTIDAAPWLEAAYQLLMRAYSRQNLRSRALRTYAEAQDALRRELAVEPSPLTQWLYRRLQAGEGI
jgi:DNA-binding SARP family transcriptional activator